MSSPDFTVGLRFSLINEAFLPWQLLSAPAAGATFYFMMYCAGEISILQTMIFAACYQIMAESKVNY